MNRAEWRYWKAVVSYGMKNRTKLSIQKINHLEYLTEIQAGKEDFFLQSLFKSRNAP